MNVALFIARKLQFGNKDKKNAPNPSIRIAIIGIALGLAVIIISVAIVTGFKQEIQGKVIGFGSHIQVTSLSNNTTYDTPPIIFPDSLIQSLKGVEGVKHVQRFSTKPAIIKTDNEFQGIVIKGIDNQFNWDFFAKNLVAGTTLQLADSTTSNDVIISEALATTLQLKVGDDFLCYFVKDNIRARKFKIKGIYNSHFSDFDKLFVLADMRHIQRLNGWEEEEITGVEILVTDYGKLDEITESVFRKTANRFEENGNTYYTRSIKQLQPQLFGWLDLLDMNVWVILVLMLTVAGFSMISGLLILILERTNMIGVVKALGGKNWFIRKIFLYQAFFLVGKGMLWGNIVGIGLALIQQQFSLIALDPITYYVSTVPINLNLLYILGLNILCLFFSLLVLLLPSHMIAKIEPSKAIRFE
ncbi:MAG: ABC transporter permease [Paludibacteraceae bacterium]|nr:ABC transporter permease [Paludibacteraceae bacterium]MBP6283949.1 ABC transporter permease [Paludibacteraceae bacterium]